MIYYLHFHDEDAPQQYNAEAARLLIENSHEDEQVRAELQAGEKVHIRSGYLPRGDLN
jgi:hypothetical protein